MMAVYALKTFLVNVNFTTIRELITDKYICLLLLLLYMRSSYITTYKRFGIFYMYQHVYIADFTKVQMTFSDVRRMYMYGEI